MFKHNLTACLNLQRRDKNGKFPLRLRITVQRKPTYFPTNITLTKDQWDGKAKKVINHPNKDAINTLLRKKLAELEGKIIEATLKGEALKKPKPQHTDFLKYAESKIKEQTRVDKEATTRRKKGNLNVLQRFRSRIPFEAITTAFLHSYEDHLKKVEHNSNNAIWSHIKFIKGMLNEAAKDELYDKKLIADYKAPKYIDPEREYLVLEEVDKIEAFRNETPIAHLRNVADWFLFACYTGFRYEDVRAFTRATIRQGKIILRTSKKGTDVTLAIHPRLQKVLDRMPAGVYTNQKCNSYLKIVAAGAVIDKVLSMHIARHSFAVIFLELGGSIEALQKLLGHQKISTTGIYGKITNRRLDDEIDNTWGQTG